MLKNPVIDKKVYLISQEITVNKYLASNDSKVRRRGLSALKEWLKKVSHDPYVKLDDYNRVWTGLFYYFWMADKPLVQEAAAERISSLIYSIEPVEPSMMFIRGFFSTLAVNFDSISHHRTDKFLMLMRRFLRHGLLWLKNKDWNVTAIDAFSVEIYKAQQILPFTLLSHLNDIFNEEVAKVSKGRVSTDVLISLLKGYMECLADLKPNMRAVNDIQARIFSTLCKQLKLYLRDGSTIQNKDTNKMIDENERKPVSNESENVDINSIDNIEEEDGELDPRPGKVDVVLPFINLDETRFISILKEYHDKSLSNRKAKNILQHTIQMFNGITSLRKKIEGTTDNAQIEKNNARKKALQLLGEKYNKKPKKSKRFKERTDDEIEKQLQTMGDLVQLRSGSTFLTIKKVSPKVCVCSKSKYPKIISPKLIKCTCNARKSKVNEFKKGKNAVDGTRVLKFQIDDTESPDCKNDKSNETDTAEKQTDNYKDNCSDANKNESLSNMAQTLVNMKVTVENENVDEAICDKKIEEKCDSDDAKFRDKMEIISCLDNVTNLECNSSELPIMEHVINNDAKKNNADEIIATNVTIEEHEEDSVKCNKNPSDTSTDKATCLQLKNDKQDQDVPMEEIKNTENGESEVQILNRDHPDWIKVPRDKVIEIMSKSSNTTTEPNIPTKRVLRSSSRLKLISEKRRKVCFTLQNNSIQELSEYKSSLKLKPTVPYDAQKEPAKGVLKLSANTTPINPFYKMKSKLQIKKKTQRKKS